MSHQEGAAEVTLKTEVEAGASGYSVTGGGHQGIFVQQVLKESSAAKLFSLREGDQLLSTTIFFDDIKYEDALKILQYSEPYKVQFRIRRKLPGREDEEGVPSDAHRGPKALKKQDEEATDLCPESPTKTLEVGGDQDKLLPKAREGRSRRPQERRSWPKFPALRPKSRLGPRRSHSSSEAYEREGPDRSPTSTDIEDPRLGEEQELQVGRRRRGFPSLRFRSSSGHRSKGAAGLPVAGVLEETECWDTEVSLSPERRSIGAGEKSEVADLVARHREKKGKEDKQSWRSRPQGGQSPEEILGDPVQGLEVGIAKLSLQDPMMASDTPSKPPEIRIQILHLKTPRFGVAKQTVLNVDMDTSEGQQRKGTKKLWGEGEEEVEGKGEGPSQENMLRDEEQRRKEERAGTARWKDETEDKNREVAEGKLKMPKLKTPSFGWSPSKDPKTPGAQLEKQEAGIQVRDGRLWTLESDKRQHVESEHKHRTIDARITLGESTDMGGGQERELLLENKDNRMKAGKFKMPSFKMPSFGVSTPGKSIEEAADMSMPEAHVEVSHPGLEGDVKTCDLTIQLPSADVDLKAGKVGVQLPEGQVPEVELGGEAVGAGLKGHMPKFQMPGVKMSKVELKGPKVDLKSPKVDLKGSKAEITSPGPEMSLPSVDVDSQVPRVQLEGDVALEGKDVAAKESKFKMPKFKMPSFGMSAVSKDLGTQVDLPGIKVGEEASMPSMAIEITPAEGSITLPSADISLPEARLDVTLPEVDMPAGEMKGKTEGLGLKVHLPKVQMPGIKMPKVDLKGPKVDVSLPDVDLSLPKVAVDASCPERSVGEVMVEGDLKLGDKDFKTKEGKFKMPSFKMPSFGMSTPGRSIEAAADMALPEAQVEVSLPGLEGDVKTGDLTIQLPSADVDLKAGKVGVQLPEGQVPEVELGGEAVGVGLKGHMPKFQMPGVKMPKVDLKGPKVDLKGPKVDLKGSKAEITSPGLEVSLPSVDVDGQVPRVQLEGDMSLEGKDLTAKESKFKMPKFKMPSFGMSAVSKDLGTPVDLPAIKGRKEESLPSMAVETTPAEGRITLPSAGVSLAEARLDVTLPEVDMPAREMKGEAEGLGLKVHLPKVQMPSIKMPKVDLKGPKVDVSLPDVDLSLPKVAVDASCPERSVSEVMVEGDLKLRDKDFKTKEGKFKMPSFKMPSFGMSMPGKTIEAAADMALPETHVEVSLPGLEGDVKTGNLTIQLPSADVDLKIGKVGVQLPEGQVPEVKLAGESVGTGLKGHMPKFQMPGVKMPKVDLKGPKMDLKGTKAEITSPSLEVSLPGVDVDGQVPRVQLEGDVSLEGKDVAAKDSKFKMPKFKMPSFGLSAVSKDLGTPVDLPGIKGGEEESVPSVAIEITPAVGSITLPSTDISLPEARLDMTLPEVDMPAGEMKGKTEGLGLKVHLPKVQMPGIKMPKVDLKGPKVDISLPDVDLSLPKVAVDTSVPECSLQDVKVKGDLKLRDKDPKTKEVKFKMPSFKMPSFGMSTPGKPIEVSADIALPEAHMDVSLPGLEGDVKTGDLTIQLPSADVDLKAGKVGVQLPENQLPEVKLEGEAVGAGLKGHMPKFQMPGVKMPKVDLKGPKVDLKGTKVDLKGTKAEITSPALELSLPSVDVDGQVPRVQLEGDVSMEGKDVAAKDSKFKMPKFKMPSFGMSAVSKDLGTPVDLPAIKVGEEASVPSMAVEITPAEGRITLPSADVSLAEAQLDVTLPEVGMPAGDIKGKAEGLGVRVHMPKVEMSGIKMPKVDVKAPKVDISLQDMDLSLPKVEVDTSVPECSLQDVKVKGDLKLRDKDIKTKEGKFTMPSFKMPSFGMSTPGKSIEAATDMTLPEAHVDVSLPGLEGDVKTGDLTIQLPSADVDLKAGNVGLQLPESQLPEVELGGEAVGAGLKGNMPKFQMPGVKMPKVDLKGPKVDLKGTKVDLKGSKAEITSPALEVSLPSVDVDGQVPRVHLEGDVSLEGKDVVAKESKFKMPKFKMPSFGMSAVSKDLGTPVYLPAIKVGEEASVPSMAVEITPAEGSITLPSADISLPEARLDVTLPEVDMPAGEMKGKTEGLGLNVHLPKVEMPGIKMPKVDLKGPKVDINLPDVDLSLPKVAVDTSGPECSLQDVKVKGDLKLRDKDPKTKEGKFKMPSFKMPSFGMSTPGKPIEVSADMALPEAHMDVSLPGLEDNVKTGDLTIQLPSADVDLKAGKVGVQLPESQLPEIKLEGEAVGVGLKGHMPKFQMPGVKIPKVDLKGPKVDLKGTKVDLKGSKAEITSPALEVSLPSLDVDGQVPRVHLEGDVSLECKDVAAKESKFKMPKFKMPSFGMSAVSKDLGTPVGLPGIKVGEEASVPSMAVEITPAEGTITLPSADVSLAEARLEVTLPEVDMHAGEMKGKAEGLGLKVHLPKVQMPGIKMPKVDMKGPNVDISLPDVDLTLPKITVDASGPEHSIGEVMVEGDLKVGDKDIKTKEGKFTMPSFKMPSFGMSTPGKSIKAAADISLPEAHVEVSLPGLEGDVKTGDLTIQLPSADVDLKAGKVGVQLPEGQVPEVELAGEAVGAGLKGHMSTFQMPGVKMPKVDLTGPKVGLKGPKEDLKGTKVDLKGTKAEITSPDLEVSLPSVDVDSQVPRVQLQGGVSLAGKDVAAKDSQFKMPEYKMPSFGMSAVSMDLGTPVDLPGLQVGEKASVPSLAVEITATEGGLTLPSADVSLPEALLDVTLPEVNMPTGEMKGKAEGLGLKVHLPKVQMPSIKMSKVDLKDPKVDVSLPDVDLSLPKVMVDASCPERSVSEVMVEGDLKLRDKDFKTKEGKFMMPSFKMPSFGMSTPGKPIEAAADMALPEAHVQVSLPALEGDVKTGDLTIQLPSADVDLKAGKVGVQLPEGQVPEVELAEEAVGAGLKGHMPKFQMPSVKMPKVDVKGTEAEIKSPGLELSLPSMDVDSQEPRVLLEGDVSLEGKDVAAKESKFKMPKFKMPSFRMSAVSKDLGTPVDLPAIKLGEEASVPSMAVEMTPAEGSITLPSADVSLAEARLDVTLPEVDMPAGEMTGKVEGLGPKVQMPGIKIPKVDLKGPKVDVSLPDVDLSLPKVMVDASCPERSVSEVMVEGDLKLGDKDFKTKEGKFKMPSFKMPSFGMSTPGKPIETAADMALPEAHVEVSLPGVEGDVKTGDLTIQLPCVDVDLKAGKVGVQLPDGQVPKVEFAGEAVGAGLKGHMPKSPMPDMKMPKVDLTGPKVDLKGPKEDLKGTKVDLKGSKAEITSPGLEVSLPSVDVDSQLPRVQLECDVSLAGKDVAAKDSQFKMPEFKMPSFGMSAVSKDLGTQVDLHGLQVGEEGSVPSLDVEITPAEGGITLPSGDVSLPEALLDVTLPEVDMPTGEMKGKAKGFGLKVHLPKVQMPSIKMPKVDLKDPKVDVSLPDVDLSLPKVAVDASCPERSVSEVMVEGDLKLGDKDFKTKEGKFMMPSFKMPSFGMSMPGKPIEAAADMSLPEAHVQVSLPALEGDVKTGDLSIQLPSADVDLKAGKVGVQLPESQVPEVELAEESVGAGLKGHMPKFQMPGVKMPKVNVKCPKVDLQGTEAEIKSPGLELSLPSMDVDSQVPRVLLEGDVSLEGKDVATKESKFKMPKFKMPSFGMSAVSKDLGTPLDSPGIKGGEEASVPTIGLEMTPAEGSITLPSADVSLAEARLDVTLPEVDMPAGEMTGKVEGLGLKVHLPKVQMPGIKMPKVDMKGRKVDVSLPDVDLSLPKVAVDASGPECSLHDMKVEGDLKLRDKDFKTKEGKVKMPSFKMPSFGVSTPGKAIDAGAEMSLPVAHVQVSLPGLEGDVKTGDLTIQLPSADVDLKAGEMGIKLPEGQLSEVELARETVGAGLKGHMPMLQMPSVKMPKVDLKGPKVDLKGTKSEIMSPSLEVSLPSVDVDSQVSRVQLEGDVSLEGKDMADKNGTFKMPKFKMPSFGMSGASKDLGTSLDLPVLKMSEEASVPSVAVEVTPAEGSITLPSADISLPEAQLDLTLPEVDKPVGDLKGKTRGLGLKGHLPNVQMPGIKMPKVDLKGSKLDVSLPDMDLSLPKVAVDASVPELSVGDMKVEGDLKLGDKDLKTKEGKFKVPSFKMPSFGMGTPGKSIETSADLSLPEAHVEVSVPGTEGDDKSSAVNVIFKDPSLDFQPLKCQEASSGPHLSLPSTVLDVQPPSALLECAGSVEEPAVPCKDSRFRLPRLSMPSFSKSSHLFMTPSQADEHVSGPDVNLAPSVVDSTHCVHAPDLSNEASDVSVTHPTVEDPVQHKGKEPHFKLPVVFLSPLKSSEIPVVPGHAPELPAAPALSGLSPQPRPAASQLEGSCGSWSQLVSPMSLPGRHSATLALHVPPAGSSSDSSSYDVTLTKFQVTEGAVAIPKTEFPHDHIPGPPLDGASPSQEGSAEGHPLIRAPAFQAATVPGPAGVLVQATSGRVMFPHFFKPRFVASAAAATAPECGSLAGGKEQASPPSGMALPSVASTAPTGQATHPGPDLPGEAAPEDTEREGKGSPFRMPRLKLPSLSRSPKKEAGLQRAPEGSPAPVGLGLEPEPSQRSAQTGAPDPLVEVHSDLPPEKEGTKGGARRASFVLRRLSFSKGKGSQATHPKSGQHCPSTTTAAPGHASEDQREAKVEVPGGGIPSEGQAPLSMDQYIEGPVMLKTSQTEVPAQVSLIQMEQLWEGSVVTVTFPKLKVPRFTFCAPGTGEDIFVPSVREELCPGTGPGLWVASTPQLSAGALLEQPEDTDLPTSKVRVHIQSGPGESRAVTIRSRVTPEPSEALYTQVVRESEVPASEVQTPSYGFSLLKVRIPEPPPQAGVPAATQGSVVDKQATPGADPVSADLQHDTEEPFEIISTSAGAPRPQMSLPEGPPSPQLADSDEEPAEILECSLEDSQEVSAEDEGVSKERPASKKAIPGLFRFWLPNIGFSSSVEETRPDPSGAGQACMPVQTQPEVRPGAEKASWFRFPRLGFSSAPVEKRESCGTGSSQVEPEHQEEAVIFFDAQESLSPEDQEEGTPSSRGTVASAAKTKLVRLDPEPQAAPKSAPRSPTK
ncbi:protein AHNAK2 isoform X2 [Tenrec ecaudatus]|uniref:protein AHNAK2 isoform X2 n=1 Tax=Tenrec ecaudatus TaxID=94439 RepID=UPI003F5AC9CB